MQTIAAAVVLWSLLSAMGLFALSRRKRLVPVAGKHLRFLFVIPCLNEGKVIKATVKHLLSFDPHSIVVIDDASDDNTAEQVATTADARVVLFKRHLSDARKGKGAALNAGYQFITRSNLVRDIDPSNVIVCVLDADGRLKRGALEDVGQYFGDPRTGACQISVRIRNKQTNFWTRMQHFEFVAFTALYQRGRERTGAVGLGGNGQFTRLTALRDLGDSPWTNCLVEDLDLGIRLLLRGWRNRYAATSWVSQQAVPEVRRLVAQRTRWFQGTLQCVRYVPRVMASPTLPLRTRVDLVCALLAPCILLLASPLVLLEWISILASRSGAGGHAAPAIVVQIAVAYGITMLPALLLAYAYWLDEPDVTFPRAIIEGHLFIVYGYLWMIAGWRGMARLVLRRGGWAKTARVDEQLVPASVSEVAA